MPVAVRNLKGTVTTFNDPPTKTALQWQPMGDREGQDIQVIPDAVLEHPSFLRAVGLGILEVVEDDEAIKSSVAAQAKRYVNSQREEVDALSALIDRSTNGRDIIISESEMNEHITRMSKGKESNLEV